MRQVNGETRLFPPFLKRSLRPLAVVLGLSLVTLSNLYLAPQLTSGRVDPIMEAPEDFFDGEGWGSASYFGLPWWLSESLPEVEIRFAGYTDGRVGVFLTEQVDRFEDVRLVGNNHVLYPENVDAMSVADLRAYRRTARDQKILCRPDPEADTKLCDVLVAWSEGATSKKVVTLVVVYLGEESFLIVEDELLEVLGVEVRTMEDAPNNSGVR